MEQIRKIKINGKEYSLPVNDMFIRFSAHPDGTDYTEEQSEDQNYIGFASGETAPTEKEAYLWLYLASEKDINGKLDKITGAGDRTRVYTIEANGTQNNMPVSNGLIANTILALDNNGNIVVAEPTHTKHPATKNYVDDGLSGKLNKVTDLGYDGAVAINKNNEQIFISINSAVVNHSMMFRDSNGRSKIADPAEDLDIANKKYADSLATIDEIALDEMLAEVII